VLPLPWPYSNQNDPRAGQRMTIQIVLREPAPGSCFAESPVQPYISVDDPDVGALLGFLGRRDLQSASRFLCRLLSGFTKGNESFGSGSGGYILLAAGGLRGASLMNGSAGSRIWLTGLNGFPTAPSNSLGLSSAQSAPKSKLLLIKRIRSMLL